MKKKIMKSVIKGWEIEVDHLEQWDEEKKKSYMKIYNKKKILMRSEKKSDEEINKRFKEHKKAKVK